jgi:transcriptional regulator with PAS, ATPase and Fis domain
MESILEIVRTVAPTTSTVLVTGETGTGKELVARAIHQASLRREKPFVSIKCGAFPETLRESELFGYLDGVITGAEFSGKDVIESANGGTLYLDEIGETSLGMQVKLLRVLQERTVRPVGGSRDVPVDVRLIASTNREWPVSRGFLLPRQCHSHSRPTLAGTPQRYRTFGATLPTQVRPPDGEAAERL